MSVKPIPVLLYHRVDRSGHKFSTTPEDFERHLSWLDEHGYRTVTSSELKRILTQPDSPRPDRTVAITFDDGFSCLDTEVAPALRRHDYTGVAFVITGRMNEPASSAGDDKSGGEVLGWDAARLLANEGVLEFHTHTHHHRQWAFGPEEAATVADELGSSRAILAERLGRPESEFDQVAWPYGRTCDEWETEARNLGMTTHYVVQRGAIDRQQTHRIPRLLVDGMRPAALAGWMNVLSNPTGARSANRVFGAIRELRQGAGYR